MGWCSTNELSDAPFGVNPHFLSTSSLFDPTLLSNMSQLDNSSFGFKLVYNPQGLPYGFIYPQVRRWEGVHTLLILLSQFGSCKVTVLVAHYPCVCITAHQT